MPELHDLSPNPGSHRNRKRVGRGRGSGKGKRAGRGQDGQGSRSGGGVRRGFEGGQMPLQRRIPKRGFTNIHRVEYQVVNVRDISGMEPGEVTPEILYAHGLVRKLNQPVKILGTGEIDGAYQVSAHKFSASAKSKIEAAGGTVSVMARGSASVEEAPEAEAAADEPAEEAAVTEEAPAPEEGEEASEAEEEQA